MADFDNLPNINQPNADFRTEFALLLARKQNRDPARASKDANKRAVAEWFEFIEGILDQLQSDYYERQQSGDGWVSVYAGDFTSAPAEQLQGGTNSTVEVNGVTWTSNDGDATGSVTQGSVSAFETASGTGLTFEGDAVTALMTDTAHNAAHIWASWADLLGREPKPGASYAVLVRLQGASAIDAALNNEGAGIALYEPNDGSGDSDTSPTIDERMLSGSIERVSGSARIATREGTSDIGWRTLPSAGSPSPNNDVVALIIESGVMAHSAVGEYGAGPMPSPSDLEMKGRTWLGVQQGFTNREYLQPNDRVALFFATFTGGGFDANITHVEVFEKV